MTIVAIVILLTLLGISVYVNINTLRKLEEQEDYVKEMEETLIGFDAFVIQLYGKVKNGLKAARIADTLGSFESDDETGAIFTNLKEIIEDINKEFEWQDNEAETNSISRKRQNKR
jgi:hypothetical protein